MILINDEYDEVWVWVTKHNHDLDLSPRFDDREAAIKWLKYIQDHIEEAHG